MAGKLNALALVLVSLAILLYGAAAQMGHVVGGATSWTIPPGGASTYTTWASNQTFKLGDTLVFNFANGQHDVAKVTKATFDACNTSGNTIFTLTSSPASVKLNESGEQYYICTFGNHCSLGQKLAINVTQKAASSPAPQPSAAPKSSPPAPEPAVSPSPTSAPTPAPSPSTGAVTYTVGDKMGWTVPTSGSYKSWASSKTFKVGDILVFNFAKNVHNVAEVTKTKYDACNTASPLATYTEPPVRVTLNKSGEHYYICAIPGHCSSGQKLAINVTAAGGTATPPSSSPATPPSSSAASPPSTASSPGSPPSTTNPSSPSPTGAASPPPQNSGATSLGAAGLCTAVMWIAAALLC